MNIQTAIEKIDSLSLTELNHTLQLLDVQIKNYTLLIENYPPDRMERYGKPYLKRLSDQRDMFLEKIAQKKKEDEQM